MAHRNFPQCLAPFCFSLCVSASLLYNLSFLLSTHLGVWGPLRSGSELASCKPWPASTLIESCLGFPDISNVTPSGLILSSLPWLAALSPPAPQTWIHRSLLWSCLSCHPCSRSKLDSHRNPNLTLYELIQPYIALIIYHPPSTSSEGDEISKALPLDAGTAGSRTVPGAGL